MAKKQTFHIVGTKKSIRNFWIYKTILPLLEFFAGFTDVGLFLLWQKLVDFLMLPLLTKISVKKVPS